MRTTTSKANTQLHLSEQHRRQHLAWEKKLQLGRLDRVKNIPTEVLNTAFNLPTVQNNLPVYGGVALTNGNYVIITLTSVQTPSVSLANTKQRQNTQNTLAALYGDFDYSLYQTEKMQAAKIKYNHP